MPRDIALFVAAAALAAAGCPASGPAASTSNTAVSQPATPDPTSTAPADDAPAPRGPELCVDLDDLQSEPIDFDALAAEAPRLAVGDRQQLYEPDKAIAFGDNGAFAYYRCRAGACSAHIGTAAGRSAALPDIDEMPKTHTLRYDAALADVDSNGADDLWVSYIPAPVDDTTPSSDFDTVGRIAAFSLPDLEVQLHVIAYDRSDRERPCESVLYAVDANCDGSGDVVHVMRCGDAACFSDDVLNTPDCAGAVKELRDLYLWAPKSATYRRAGSKP